MRACLLKSPGFFSVFWPISTLLYLGWFPLIFLFSSPPLPVPILWWLYRVHQLQLIFLSLLCSIAFFSSLARSRYLSLCFLSFKFTLWSATMAKFTVWQVFSFFFTITRSGHLAEIRWSVCISKPREVFTSHFPGQILSRAYTICSSLNFLQYSQWITFPIQPCLVLYSICINYYYYNYSDLASISISYMLTFRMHLSIYPCIV